MDRQLPPPRDRGVRQKIRPEYNSIKSLVSTSEIISSSIGHLHLACRPTFCIFSIDIFYIVLHEIRNSKFLSFTYILLLIITEPLIDNDHMLIACCEHKTYIIRILPFFHYIFTCPFYPVLITYISKHASNNYLQIQIFKTEPSCFIKLITPLHTIICYNIGAMAQRYGQFVPTFVFQNYGKRSFFFSIPLLSCSFFLSSGAQ